ncbi:NFACT family protein [Candidatus Woesearchaeota archaeon]|nr:NFACT family protein [Candidatus Woesearchaeota archaeon]
MPKTTLSSVELAAVVEELQMLIPAKISRVYDYEERGILLELHVREKGKQLLRIIPGKFLNLTTSKESPIQPSGFCQQLRKYLDSAIITSLRQKDSERILVLEIEKEQRHSLILEFFSKGNIILTDETNTIITCLERQTWKDRTVKPGEKYLFPPAPINWKEINEAKLYQLLQKSGKKSVIISLATEVGLGGLYAEELCKNAGIDKEKNPKNVSFTESAKIMNELQKIKESLKKPLGFFYEEEIYPFALTDKTPKTITQTYNEALDTLKPFKKKSPYENKIEHLQRTIATQEEAIKIQKEKIIEESRKGESIYENYTFFQQLLDHAKELFKKEGIEAVEQEIKKDKKNMKVDKFRKKIAITI